MFVVDVGREFLLQENNRVRKVTLTGEGLLAGEWVYGDEAQELLRACSPIEQIVRADSIIVECGQFDFKKEAGQICIGLDGQPLRRVRRIELVVEAKQRPIIKLEVLP